MSTRSLRRPRQSSSSQGHTEKENVMRTPASAKSSKAVKLYCSCRQPDDGSPMICCAECKEWFHFKCLQLDSRDAEDIEVYVCPSCTANSGLHTVMEWEGPEAIEERSIDPALLSNTSTKPGRTKHHSEPEEPEESTDDGSGDEYVAEAIKPKGKRRAQVHSSDSEEASDHDSKSKSVSKQSRRPSTLSISTKRRSTSGSPGPNSPAIKRRKSTVSHEPNSKRKRSESVATSVAAVDAARKYCSSKLQEIFVGIFLKYPVLPDEGAEDELVVMKKADDLTAEEKGKLEEQGRQFATELEECIFATYSEPDAKTGHPTAGMKYKERFRMLTFNLSKADRVVLHQRIAASHITPKDLSTMSSTDLADEETKQSIKQAEQEALAHSILKKTMMPTAKMTHKGMQDIEDVNGALFRERREREQEEEDRIERERLERLKLQAQRVQAAHGLMSPDSPTTPSTAGWGAPPPVPLHAMHGSGPSPSRPPLNPLFIHTSSEMITSPVEQELNLADLINIDDEPGQELSISLADPVIPPISDSVSGPPESATSEVAGQTPQSPAPLSATGLSPFASRSSHPDFTSRPSFDLNAIWSRDSDAAQNETKHDTQDATMQEPDASPEQHIETPAPVEASGEGAEDLDFDMFLQGGEEETEEPALQPTSPEAIQAAFDASAHVWTGKISMPLDLSVSQEVSVMARQIGGRTLGGDSLLWRTLFPTDHLRIDGRVPIDKSAEYLTQMRLNPHKELIAVAFAPESEVSTDSFATLSKYLISKNRHGLVFPWGNRPKEHHPGRELYIVPLVASEPLPEFLELLDEMKLPQTRQSDFMVGIWVLNKGKLAPPPTLSIPPVPAAATPPAVPPSIPPAGPSPVPPSAPPPALASLPASLIPALGSLPPNVSAEALAAEVATLTPDQIQLMLQTLAATSGHQSPPVPPSGSVPPGSVPPVPPTSAQPWMANAPAPYPPYGPPFGSQSAPYPPPPPPPQERYDYEQDRPPYPYTSGHQYDSYDHGGDRGYRGRGSQTRNRDRGGHDRPRDNGWRGRGRGRGRGGDSRDRGKQWSGPPPQQW